MEIKIFKNFFKRIFSNLFKNKKEVKLGFYGPPNAGKTSFPARRKRTSPKTKIILK